MNTMRAFFAKFQKDERGVTAIEYGLIAMAMAALLTVVFAKDTGIRKSLENGFTNISTNISGASSTISATSKL
ncbi:Flp family type IVb pilin [Photobacterium leiognathi]|uniref:Flp family type IVb pilin n=1 Tax=Photobacterium leiognathi TaxID=553611 RepID=UPI002982A58D|nr:Flp family type IVb pilin [Photobacterium leiognathi]